VSLVLLVHAGATVFMVGVIWFVQVVHYPLFGLVGAGGFVSYSEAHSRRTGYVVGPPMLTEAATAILLLLYHPEGVPVILLWIGAFLLAVVWASTALLQVPRHTRLGAGFDGDAYQGLVATNWVRTLGWTLRGVLVFAMLVLAAG
jgi:hypothetical protein